MLAFDESVAMQDALAGASDPTQVEAPLPDPTHWGRVYWHSSAQGLPGPPQVTGAGATPGDVEAAGASRGRLITMRDPSCASAIEASSIASGSVRVARMIFVRMGVL